MSRKPPPSDSAVGEGSYEVGYCKPPRHTRFKPGESGYPRGRPKGTRNLKTDLADELAERIVISEGGRRRAISKQRAMLKQLMAKALKGDVRAASTILDRAERLLDARSDAPDETLAADRQAILDAYVARQTRPKDSSAPSPVLAPPELLDDDAPDEADK
jgi:hypothetical protein